jgi:hypothetical protein
MGMFSETTEFSTGVVFFCANKNIQDSYQAVESTLEKLRFKRANFKWSEYDSASYYTISSKADNYVGE